MQWIRQTQFKLAVVALGAVMALPRSATAASSEPTAELSPSQIALDQAAELRVDAAANGNLVLPHVDGLHIRHTGQSTEMTSINGVTTQHTWILYQVVADRPGSYSIPVGTHSLTLEVDSAGSAAVPAPAGPVAVFSPAPSGSVNQGSPPGSLALLRVVLSSKKVVVGQAVPVTFKAYFRAGTEVTVSGVPSLGIPAFTINHLEDNPRQSVEDIGGVPYRVATWTGQASAAMPGHFTTHATLPIVARYQVASQAPAADPFAGFLDDDDAFSGLPSAMLRSFMKQSAFGAGLGDMFGQTREREMTLSAPSQTLEVVSPPSKGQPANYNGAVGRFDLHTTLSPTSGTTFAPMTLKTEVTGQGNLERVWTGSLPSSVNWKTYPPSATITPQGTKVFEQAVVPQTSGHLDLPALSFSFFDPDRNQYVTRSSEPIGVEISASSPGGTHPAVALNEAPPKEKPEPTTGLRPNRSDEGRFVATLLPPYRRSWFWPVVAVPWLGLALVAARPRARASARTRQRALRDTIARHRLAMKRAAAAGDSVHFHEAAATALRERLGAMWKIPPAEVTAAEAAARLGQHDEPIVATLRSAEQLRYGAAVEQPSSFETLAETIERKLDQLEE